MEKHELWSQTELINGVNLSEPHFSHLQNGDYEYLLQMVMIKINWN